MENEIEKAIELLEDFTRTDRGMRSAFPEFWNDYDKFCEEKCVAIDILLKVSEKQKPKEPLIKIMNYSGLPVEECPECGCRNIGFYKTKYCPNCGQLLKWEE
jgi:endogenous inhibitor of DNA gyrase (YacG/DUF329 family)